MADATIRIPTPLRSFTGGAGEVAVSGNTVRGALDALAAQHEGVLEQVLDADGRVRACFVPIRDGEAVPAEAKA